MEYFYRKVMRNICKASLRILRETCKSLRRWNWNLSLVAAITNYYSREKKNASRDARTRTYRSTKSTTKSVDGTDTDGGRIGGQGRRGKRRWGKRVAGRWRGTSCGGTNGAGVVRGLEMWMFRNLAHTGVRSFRFWVTTAWPCGPSGSKPPPRDEDVRPAPLRDDRAHSFPPELTLR